MSEASAPDGITTSIGAPWGSAAGADVVEPRSEITHWTPRTPTTTAATSTARRTSRRAV